MDIKFLMVSVLLFLFLKIVQLLISLILNYAQFVIMDIL